MPTSFVLFRVFSGETSLRYLRFFLLDLGQTRWFKGVLHQICSGVTAKVLVSLTVLGCLWMLLSAVKSPDDQA